MKNSENNKEVKISSEITKDKNIDSINTRSAGLNLTKEINHPKTSRKRKREKKQTTTDEESEDEEEAFIDKAIEEKLQECSKRNNLSSTETKQILKKIVENDHVLALVKIQEENEIARETEMNKNQMEISLQKSNDDDETCMPKFTRAKARELNKQPISITPLNETVPVPEVAALISQELHSDEEDEEYEPREEDYVSDDDINNTISDMDSQPNTPMTPFSHYEPEDHGTPTYSNDGLFKVPRQRNDSVNSQQEEIIAKRTRSKLCLQTIPIETIESNFRPPDITTDMYDFDAEIDPSWLEFLNEYSKPLNACTEEDDETDPEYVAADKVPMDKEELRDANISKKELNDLLAEIFGSVFPDDPPSEGSKKSSQLETPKNSPDRYSPQKKRPRIVGDQEDPTNFITLRSSQNITQTDTRFNPNIISTPTQNLLNMPTENLGYNLQNSNISHIPYGNSPESMNFINTELQNNSQFQYCNITPTKTVPQQTIASELPSPSPKSYQTLSNVPYQSSSETPNIPTTPNDTLQPAPLINYQVAPTITFQPPAISYQLRIVPDPVQPNTFAIVPTIVPTARSIPLRSTRSVRPNVSNSSTIIPNQTVVPIQSDTTITSNSLRTVMTTESSSSFQLNQSIDSELITSSINTVNKTILKPISRTPVRSQTAIVQPLPKIKDSIVISDSEAPPRSIPKKRKRIKLKNRTKKSKTEIKIDYLPYEVCYGGSCKSIKKMIHVAYAKKYEYLKTTNVSNYVFDEKHQGFTEFQLKIFEQQMRIHVQFATQNFLQTYAHPELWKYANQEKEILLELKDLSKNDKNSPFNPRNLEPALELVTNWEKELSVDNLQNRKLIQFLNKQVKNAKITRKNNLTYIMEFPERLMHKIISSPVFIYPEMLPRIPFRICIQENFYEMIPTEDIIIAQGLEYYFKKLKEDKMKWNPTGKKIVIRLPKVCDQIAKNLTRGKSPNQLFLYVQNRSKENVYFNPIKYYFLHKRAPPVQHELFDIDLDNIKTPRERVNDLPLVWHEFVKKVIENEQLAALKSSDDEDEDLTSFNEIQNSTTNNSFESTNVTINFNYVLNKEDLNNVPSNTQSLLNSNPEDISRISEEVQTSQTDQIITRIHEPITTDSFSELQLYKIGNNFTSSSPSRSSVTCTPPRSPKSIPAILECISTAHIEIQQQPVKIDDSERFIERPKGQKLLTDFYQIKECKTNENESLKSDQSTTDTQIKYIKIKRRKRKSFKRKIPFYRLKKHRFLTKKLYKISRNQRRNKQLRRKLQILLVTYRGQYLSDCETYSNEHIRWVFTNFKALELYTNLLIRLKMNTKKFKTNLNCDENLTKKMRPGEEDSNRAKKFNRCGDHLKQMLLPESKEENNEKDAIYALNFYDKVEEIFQKTGKTDDFEKFQKILRSFDPPKDSVADLYYKLENLFLPHFPELAEIFLTFLLPSEAAEIGKFFEHFMLTNMGTFINKLQIYFHKQPAQIKKIYSILNELSEDSNVSMEKIKKKILPLLKGNQFLTDWFIQTFPCERPPESLMEFPEIVHLKNTEIPQALENFETVLEKDLVQDSQEEQPCQIKYINGRIFYGGSRILLPAKLAFLASDLLKVENENTNETEQDTISTNLNNNNNNNNENENSNPIVDSGAVCVHGIRDFGEQQLKSHIDNMDSDDFVIEEHHETIETVETQNFELCDEDIFRAHATRLNSSLYPPHRHEQPQDPNKFKSIENEMKMSPKKQFAPKPINSPSTIVFPSKDIKRKSSPKKNFPKSPSSNQLKRSPNSLNSLSPSSDTITGGSSPAIETAKKLKLIVDGIETDNDNEENVQTEIVENGNNEESISSPDDDDSTLEKDTSPKILSDISLNDSTPDESKVVIWTRDEDKIILEEVKCGVENEQGLVSKLLTKLPHRTELEILSRHQFLMDVLTQLQKKN